MSERPAEAKPCPRIKATLLSARHFREIAALFHVGDKQVGVPELVGDVPYRHLGADEAAGMDHRAQRRRLRDAERQDVLSMGVNDSMDVGPRLVDRGMNEALEVERTLLVAHRLAVEAQLDDVLALHQLGRDRVREEEMLGIVGIADAHVAVGVHHLLSREDTVGDDQILNDVTSRLLMVDPTRADVHPGR